MRSLTTIILVWLFGLVVISGSTRADEIFIDSRLGDVKIIDGAIPAPFEGEYWQRLNALMTRDALYPYGNLDQPGEVYIMNPEDRLAIDPYGNLADLRLHIRVNPPGDTVTGTIYLPGADFASMQMVRFELPDLAPRDAAEISFYQAQYAHYDRLISRNIPGTAWYRHQRNKAEADLKSLDADPPPDPPFRAWRPDSFLPNTYALFSGGRAVSENLALDQALPISDESGGSVSVDTIEGITINEFDWTDLIKDKEPEVDPLATLIPHDQHAIFFPNFQAMVDLIDSSSEYATPILSSIEPHAENVMVRERYEKQLCLPLDTLGRTFGPHLIDSIAVTGSDPYLPTGSDLAILFEAKNTTGLKTAIALQYTAAQSTYGASIERGNLKGVTYTGVRTDDRSISTYMINLDNAVIVTNSLAQLENIIGAYQSAIPSLDELDEYTFFRDRYQRDANDETALIILSDATIRRWCGPRWRIGTSRRTRAIATMMDLQATYMTKFVKGDVAPGPIYTDVEYAHLGDLEFAPHGIQSSTFGSLGFQTPIVELDLDLISKTEAEHYGNWRTGYQNAWRNTFDPIAIQFSVTNQRLAIDLSVMPLIVGSEYRQFIDLSSGAVIAQDAGDLHPGTLLHLAFAINKESQTAQMGSGMAVMFAPEIGLDPLGWLGESVSLYIEDDPLWEEAIRNDNDGFLFDEGMSRLPIALHCEVESGIRLTAFLAAARAYIDQSAPDMLVWENRKHNERTYVAVSPSAMANSGGPDDDLTIFYSASGKALIITLREDLLKRAIDRQENKNIEVDADAPQPRTMPWLGKNLCLQTGDGIVSFLKAFPENTYEAQMQGVAWNNLAILNEWKRLYPDHDPLKIHEEIWKSKLVCPGGGTYIWNDEWQTMESTIFGHPGQQRLSGKAPAVYEQIRNVNSGVTFENDGLRARVEFHHEEE